MIQVTYKLHENQVTIQGHAKSDEYGRDLICAACSALAMTLDANIAELERRGMATDRVGVLEEGRAELSCRAKPGYENYVGRIVQAVCVGFELLANLYPDYISYEISP